MTGKSNPVLALIEMNSLALARPALIAKAQAFSEKFDGWPADVQAKVPADVQMHFRGLLAALKEWN